MPQDIDNIFKAKSQSVWHYLVEAGKGCYIPAYQREYSWDRGNINRLFEDVLDGLRQVTDRTETVSFLGTIIAIHDTKYSTVQPLYRSEVTSRVMTIIDGQQRLCTVIMANIALHDLLRRALTKFQTKRDNEEPEAHVSWVQNAVKRLCADLRDTYLIDQRAGDFPYLYYPRIIRAYSDAWSSKKGQAKYASPIARLIWDYIVHTEDEAQSQRPTAFRFRPPTQAGTTIDEYGRIADAFQHIQREIGRICGQHNNKYDFPGMATLTQPESEAGIWDGSMTQDVIDYVATCDTDHRYPAFATLLRLMAFSRYLNHRTAITVVTTQNEEDAFDMFEALNTTGEPLTAFETLKPKVIEAEGIALYEQTVSYTYIGTIEEYLSRFRRAEQRQAGTSNMLVPFALAETGTKLSKKLGIQRVYLRKQFDLLRNGQTLEECRTFVRVLSEMAQFLGNGWEVQRDRPSFAPLDVRDEGTVVGIRALQDLKHSITIAPLFRFYQRAVASADDATRRSRTRDFEDAVKATVAFSMLWRGGKGGTASIDDCYRHIMNGGVTPKGNTIKAMARRSRGVSSVPSLEEYKAALNTLFRDEGDFQGKHDWVRRVGDVPIYKDSHVVARFLLFCASDDSIPDELSPGLIERSRSGRAPMLGWDQWTDEKYYTVEHIAPRSKADGWEDDIFDRERTVHTLGNLILLPGDVNSVFSNRPWTHKRLMYELVSADTDAEVARLLDLVKTQSEEDNRTLSATAENVVGNADYLGMCKSVAQVQEPWSSEIIEQRTTRLAELAWDRLTLWLGAK